MSSAGAVTTDAATTPADTTTLAAAVPAALHDRLLSAADSRRARRRDIDLQRRLLVLPFAVHTAFRKQTDGAPAVEVEPTIVVRFEATATLPPRPAVSAVMATSLRQEHRDSSWWLMHREA